MTIKITASPAAQILGLSLRRVEQLASSNELSFEVVKTGNNRSIRVFDQAEVEAYKLARAEKKIASKLQHNKAA